MPDLIGYVGERLPSKYLKRLFLGRFPFKVYRRIHATNAYREFRLATTTLTHVTFASPIGPVELVLPVQSKLCNYRDYPGYEPGLASDLKATITSDSVFYDIGAHFGYASELARELGTREIHCFESCTFRHEVLMRNCDSESIYCNRTLVGDGTNETQSIDGYVSSSPNPDIVKIDIEGAEYDTLQGMRRTLCTIQPDLYIEVHPRFLTNFGHSVEELKRMLHRFGYDLEFMNHRAKNAIWQESDINFRDSVLSYLIRAVS